MFEYSHYKTEVFKRNGFKVRITVYGFKPIDDAFFESCVQDYARSLGRKKVKSDVEVVWPTIYGA
jgi:hypothetical protein